MPGSLRQWRRLGLAVSTFAYLSIGYWAGANAAGAWFFVGAVGLWTVDILLITPWAERREARRNRPLILNDGERFP